MMRRSLSSASKREAAAAAAPLDEEQDAGAEGAGGGGLAALLSPSEGDLRGWRRLLRTPLQAYDAFLVLHPLALPAHRRSQCLVRAPLLAALAGRGVSGLLKGKGKGKGKGKDKGKGKKRREFKAPIDSAEGEAELVLEKERQEARGLLGGQAALPLCGLDAVGDYVRGLRAKFGHFAAVHYDPMGGEACFPRRSAVASRSPPSSPPPSPPPSPPLSPILPHFPSPPSFFYVFATAASVPSLLVLGPFVLLAWRPACGAAQQRRGEAEGGFKLSVGKLTAVRPVLKPSQAPKEAADGVPAPAEFRFDSAGVLAQCEALGKGIVIRACKSHAELKEFCGIDE